MFDVVTGWKVSVERTGAGGPYIIVPFQQVGTLCQLLLDHRIPHAVEGLVPGPPYGDPPAEPVVLLGLAVEADRVQDLLDQEP
jgi:hypothetical protein